MQLALARARRNQTQIALFFIDLDKFKHVNDTYGHATGDILLEQAARRLEKCVRSSDTVARFGGDEFIVLLENMANAEQSQEFAKSIIAAIAKPFSLGMAFASIRASIGIAHFPQDGEDEAQLLAYADAAMYKNKKHSLDAKE
jgi:diguanylate cyclase (GGDEF)-like protein